MIAQFQGRLPAWEMTIQHDNARPHVAQLVQLWLEEHHVSLLKQPPYSLDTYLMDHYIFRNYECYRRGCNLIDREDVQNNFRAYSNSMLRAELSDEFETLKNHLGKIIRKVIVVPRCRNASVVALRRAGGSFTMVGLQRSASLMPAERANRRSNGLRGVV